MLVMLLMSHIAGWAASLVITRATSATEGSASRSGAAVR